MLRREVRAHRVAQIFVYLVRRYGMTHPFVVDVLKQLLSGELLAAPYETHQTPIVYRHFLRRATLAAKFQDQPPIVNEAGVSVT